MPKDTFFKRAFDSFMRQHGHDVLIRRTTQIRCRCYNETTQSVRLDKDCWGTGYLVKFYRTRARVTHISRSSFDLTISDPGILLLGKYVFFMGANVNIQEGDVIMEMNWRNNSIINEYDVKGVDIMRGISDELTYTRVLTERNNINIEQKRVLFRKINEDDIKVI